MNITLERRIALFACALVVLVSCSIGVSAYFQMRKILVDDSLTQLGEEARLVGKRMSTQLEALQSDTRILAKAPAIQEIIRARTVEGSYLLYGSTERQWLDQLAVEFQNLLEEKEHYFQARFIGVENNGRELVRVERDGDSVRVVDDAELQEKGARGYFLEAIATPAGSTYLSRIELNQENGQIAVPHVPVLRAAVTVFTSKGEPFGIVVLNEDVRHKFEEFRRAVIEHRDVYLVNWVGDFMIRPGEEFMLPVDRPDADNLSDSILAIPTASIPRTTSSGIASFHYLSRDKKTAVGGFGLAISPARPNDVLRILVTRPLHDIISAPIEARNRVIVLTLIVMVVAVCLSFLVARTITRPMRSIIRSVRQYGDCGDVAEFDEDFGGEIGLLNSAFKEMAVEVNARQAALEKEAKERRTAEDRLRLATTGAGVGTWHWDIVGGELLWSDKCKALFGLGADDSISYERFLDVLHPDDRSRTDSAVADALKNQSEFDIEYRAVWPDETVHWVNAKGRGYYSADAQAVRMEGIVFDVSERKHAADRTRLLNETLQIQAEELKERTVELEAKNEELRHFSYVASHDLQEPLRSISGFIQLLERRYKDELDAKALGYIQKSVDATKRMQQLIDDLLKYSRVTTHAQPLEPVDCGDVVKDVIADLQNRLKESKGTVKTGNLPTVSGDRSQLRQLFQNIISNALKFRGDGDPEVSISAVPGKPLNGSSNGNGSSEYWTISVKDNGIGIEPGSVDRVFKMFQRLHTRAEYEGTGIGLAVCKRIVERHGGTIWAESEPGDGTSFHFTMPKAGD